MTIEQKKSTLVQFARHQLNDVILPFWMNQMVDHANDGFLGRIDFSGRPVEDHTKGIILNARILWTFSAAFRWNNDPKFMSLADRAYRFIEEHFYDRDHGGYVWSLHPDKRIENGKKQVYAQAFVIYAFTEYAAATGMQEPREKALKLARLIEEKAFDRGKNGYLEAFSREWGEIDDLRLSDIDMNEKKTTNTHLHIIEAYTRLHNQTEDPYLRERLLNLLYIFTNIILQRDHHMGLFYDEASGFLVAFKLEAAWLLYQAALAAGENETTDLLRSTSEKMATAVLLALNREGGLIHEGNRNAGIVSGELEWWAQAEAIVGFLNCYETTGDEAWLDRALGVKDYIDNYFIDRLKGEWYYRVDRSGKPIPEYEKAGPWKCPYHTTRMCLEVIRRLD